MLPYDSSDVSPQRYHDARARKNQHRHRAPRGNSLPLPLPPAST